MSFEKKALENEIKVRNNNYPGRGIVIGKTPDAEKYVQIYWIMGRSSNSRNRIFVREGDSVKTQAFDEKKMEDPSLIIYYPARAYNNYHIITNGDQTDTVYDHLASGKDFVSALNTREFEPDSPNYTPRISGLVDLNKKTYSLAILKSINNDASLSQKNYYNYYGGIPGIGHCIHTYMDDGNPLPSYEGEPFMMKLDNEIEQSAEFFWNLLNEDNRISLLVKHIEVESGKTEIKIINKHN